MAEQTIGSTRTFVLAKGFLQVGNHSALFGEDDTKRLFAEVHADPDRPDVRPQEAYKAMLSSMQPGWTVRLLQLFWPDPGPRLEFQKQVMKWKSPATEGLDISRRSQRVVPLVLPVLYGSTHTKRRYATNKTLEKHDATRFTVRKVL